MSPKGWSSNAANPESTADVKKAARAASARLDGVRSVPMPPMVKYLDQDGELLEKQSMSDELALEGYRVMVKGRRFDERSVSLQRQGRMVTLAPGVGQEAATVGAAMALDATTDWFVPQYRELAGQLWHGYPLRLAFLWHVGHPIAFRVPDGRCDGNDMFAVYKVVRDAAERARAGAGPTLVEAMTYRLGLHTTADDPSRYEPREMHDLWVNRDPLLRMQRYLKTKGVVDAA